jgi:hypothetical protein
MIALVFEVYGELCFLLLIAFLVLTSGGRAIPTGYRLAKTCWRTLAPPSQRSRAYSQARRACDPSPRCRTQAPPAAARSRRSQARVRPHRRGYGRGLRDAGPGRIAPRGSSAVRAREASSDSLARDWSVVAATITRRSGMRSSILDALFGRTRGP